jgi:hypothetical protein
MINRFYIGVLLSLLFACSNESTSTPTLHIGAETIDTPVSDVSSMSEKPSALNSEQIQGISYSIKALSGLEFIERKGESPDPEDIAFLEEETVLLFEFEENEIGKKIFDSEQLTFDKDEAIKYLSGKIIGDIEIEQGEEKLIPDAALYEGISSSDSKIRVVLFFTELDKNKEFTLQYYDRLFGAGLIKLINKN